MTCTIYFALPFLTHFAKCDFPELLMQMKRWKNARKFAMRFLAIRKF